MNPFSYSELPPLPAFTLGDTAGTRPDSGAGGDCRVRIRDAHPSAFTGRAGSCSTTVGTSRRRLSGQTSRRSTLHSMSTCFATRTGLILFRR